MDTPLRVRFFILHNRNAGSAAQHFFRATLARMRQAGACAEIVETPRHGEGMKAVAEAAQSGRYDAVVAAGGDGTLHHAAEWLVGRSTPLGIIPMGTGNVLARELNLPSSPDRLARTLLRGEARAIPVGQVNGRPFVFVVGVGFDAEAVRLFEMQGNRVLGRAGYVWPLLRALSSYEDRTLRVKTQRGQNEGQWVIVTRIKHYAGDLMLVPQADLHRERLYVLRIAGSGPLHRTRQLSALALGLLRYDPGVSIEAATWVRINGDLATPVQIDGEVHGELPLEIGIHPDRLNLIFPIDGPGSMTSRSRLM